jgi:paspaline synthase
MDGFGDANAPPAYQAVKPTVDVGILLMGVGWAINYTGMLHKSFQDRTYGMAIMPLCSNIAWEVVYGLIYPSPNPIEQGVFLVGLFIDFAIIYAAIRFSPNEWTHAPLVRDNLLWIFLFGIVGFTTGFLALAAEIGPALAYTWGAVFCQLLLSLGAICQLLCRCSTRGASYTIW